MTVGSRRVSGWLAALVLPTVSQLSAGEAVRPTASLHTPDVRPGLDSPNVAIEGTVDYRAVSALALGGGYLAFGVWTWFAWYREQPTLPEWKLGGDGGFGVHTYAGGADKLGHVWANLVLTRLGAGVLEAGGWSDASASAIGSGLCLSAFFLVEVNDGYYTEFSPGDLAADVVGVLGALAFRHVPLIDDALDFRVAWFPSAEFRRQPGADFAEDYSGQTYLLAFKPGVFDRIRNSNGPLEALRFFNPVIGFETRGYVPRPPVGERVIHRQSLFLGLTFDVQTLLDAARGAGESSAARISGEIGHAVFEYVNLPFSSVGVVGLSRQRTLTVPPE